MLVLQSKNIKRIFALILSACLILPIVGCGKNKKEAEEITTVVHNYMNYVVSSDAIMAATLVVSGEDVITPLTSDMNKSQDTVYNAVLGKTSYEVTSSESDSKNGKGTAEVTLKVPVINIDGCSSVDEVVAGIASSQMEEKKVTVNLTFENEKFLINAESAREINNIIVAGVVANDYSFLLSPEEVVKGYIELMSAGDVAGAYSEYTEYGSAYSLDDRAKVLSGIATAFYGGMDYETSLVSSGDEAVVKVSGTAPDIGKAMNSIYSDENSLAIMAEIIYLENNTTDFDFDNNELLTFMADIVIDEMLNSDEVDFNIEFTLHKDEEGAYRIVSPDEMIPELKWDSNHFEDEEMTNLKKDALTKLLDDERISEEEYKEIYAKYFGEEEVKETVNDIITETIAEDISVQSGGSGQVADAYYGGISYDVQVEEVTGSEATVVITGTVPDVEGAAADATTSDMLVNIMTQAAYSALNSGSIDAGRGTAEALLKDAFMSNVESKPGVPFETTIHVIIEEDGSMYIEGANNIIPDLPAYIDITDLDSSQLQACARQALGNLLGSGAITQEEYERYCSRIGDYV